MHTLMQIQLPPLGSREVDTSHNDLLVIALVQGSNQITHAIVKR